MEPLMKKAYYSDKAPKPMNPYSQAIRAGDFLFVSGQIGIEPATNKLVKGNAADETEQVFKNIAAILEVAGLKLENVVKVVLYMNDIGDSSPINEVYEKYFQEPYPARTSFAVGSLPLGAKIKIDVTAHFES